MAVPQPDIKWIGCHATNFEAGHGGLFWECVVLHTTAGGADVGALDNWFGQDHGPNNRSSAHFGIGPTGIIHQYVALTDTAYAHGIVDPAPASKLVLANRRADGSFINPNTWALSIEHLDGGIPGTVTPAQLDASQRLTAWLFDKWILPNKAGTGAAVDRDHIIGHYEIGSHPQCPSWSSQRFSDYVARVRVLLQPAGVPLPPPVNPLIKQAMDDLSAIAIGLDDLSARAALQAQSARAAVAALAKG